VDSVVRGGWHPRCRGYFRRRRRIPKAIAGAIRSKTSSCRVGIGILTHPLSKIDREDEDEVRRRVVSGASMPVIVNEGNGRHRQDESSFVLTTTIWKCNDTRSAYHILEDHLYPT
jgi:hypothetical protein